MSILGQVGDKVLDIAMGSLGQRTQIKYIKSVIWCYLALL